MTWSLIFIAQFDVLGERVTPVFSRRRTTNLRGISLS
jgi:hypothetical protein